MNQFTIVGSTEHTKVGDLEYGTYLTGIPSHPEAIYQKVNKRNLGSGLKFTFREGHSVLLNVKTGGLRQVKGEEMVIVLKMKGCLTPVTGSEIYQYNKDWDRHDDTGKEC